MSYVVGCFYNLVSPSKRKFAHLAPRSSPSSIFSCGYLKPNKKSYNKLGFRYSMASHPNSSSGFSTIGFVGAGQMAEALARGFVSSGIISADRICATDVSNERLQVFRSFGAIALKELSQVLEFSDVVILAVKPNTVKVVLENSKKDNLLLPKHLIVSIAAGVTLSNIQSWCGDSIRVIRIMPNTPCLVGETAAAMSLGTSATTSDSEFIQKIFSSVGKIFVLDEKLLDAVTGLSGSGPAYIFLAIEALADGGVFAGLPRNIALSLAAQTVLGSAKMVLETGKHPGQLKDSVASPGGTTIAGIHELEKGNFRASLMNAVIASAKRSKEMSS